MELCLMIIIFSINMSSRWNFYVFYRAFLKILCFVKQVVQMKLLVF